MLHFELAPLSTLVQFVNLDVIFGGDMGFVQTCWNPVLADSVSDREVLHGLVVRGFPAPIPLSSPDSGQIWLRMVKPTCVADR